MISNLFTYLGSFLGVFLPISGFTIVFLCYFAVKKIKFITKLVKKFTNHSLTTFWDILKKDLITSSVLIFVITNQIRTYRVN